MNRSIAILAAISLSILLSSCAMNQLSWNKEQKEKLTTKIYPFSYKQIYGDLSTGLGKSGFKILSTDEENGVLIVAPSASGNIFVRIQTRTGISLTKLDETHTRISVDTHIEGISTFYGGGLRSSDDLIGKQHYRDLFRVIDKVVYKN